MKVEIDEKGFLSITAESKDEHDHLSDWYHVNKNMACYTAIKFNDIEELEDPVMLSEGNYLDKNDKIQQAQSFLDSDGNEYWSIPKGKLIWRIK